MSANSESNEKLSALLDGELLGAELDQLLDELESSPDLAARWQRLCAVQAARKGVRIAAKVDISAGVMAAIAGAPAPAHDTRVVALTQRPDLFRAVVCQVPLLDMLRYQNFQIARLWIPEYGSAEDPKQFEYLYAYSPYHHVRPSVEYPAVLFMTADTDTRVDPMHAKKMAALMQSEAANGHSKERPILLRIDTKAGHGAGKPIAKQVEDLTDIYSFLFRQLGMK